MKSFRIENFNEEILTRSSQTSARYQRMFTQHVSLSSDKLLEVVHLLPALASIRANMFAYVLKPQNVFADSRM